MIRKILNGNRQLILKSKKRIIIRKIEKAMGFRLTEWQIRYIFDDACERSFARGTGRTTAYIIRFCLSKGEPLIVTLPYVQKEYLDEIHTPAYRVFYGKMLKDIYERLKKQRLKMRSITFEYKTSRISFNECCRQRLP